MKGADLSRNGRRDGMVTKSGRWTQCLIPELATWLDRTHGQIGFHLAQALSGHGCSNAYLKRFKKRDDMSYRYCASLVENAEHTLFVCFRWGAESEVIGRAVGAQLTLNTMVTLLLQSAFWADLAVRVDCGRNVFIPLLGGAASRPA